MLQKGPQPLPDLVVQLVAHAHQTLVAAEDAVKYKVHLLISSRIGIINYRQCRRA